MKFSKRTYKRAYLRHWYTAQWWSTHWGREYDKRGWESAEEKYGIWWDKNVETCRRIRNRAIREGKFWE